MNDRRVHELKTWPEYYQAIIDGTKTFEIRQDDRGFGVNDMLHLREWSNSDGYTGRDVFVLVTYILRGGQFGIRGDCVVMSIKIIESVYPQQV